MEELKDHDIPFTGWVEQPKSYGTKGEQRAALRKDNPNYIGRVKKKDKPMTTHRDRSIKIRQAIKIMRAYVKKKGVPPKGLKKDMVIRHFARLNNLFIDVKNKREWVYQLYISGTCKNCSCKDFDPKLLHTLKKPRAKRKIAFQEKMINEITPYEKIVKEQLEKDGIEFEFQKIVKCGRRTFYPDFTIGKLIVEIDGWQHTTKEGVKYDKTRTKLLNKEGYEVIRFLNGEVDRDIHAVMETIYHYMHFKD